MANTFSLRQCVLLFKFTPVLLEGKITYRQGDDSGRQEVMDYLEFIAHLKLAFVAERRLRPLFRSS